MSREVKGLRVPLPGLAAGCRELPDDQARYVARVHRRSAGDALLLFDGLAGTEAEATITLVTDGRVHVDIATPRPAATARTREVTLFQCLGKGDKMDAIVRDATELGASAIVPVTSERTIVKLGDRAPTKLARWRKIAEEASRQCGRGKVPDVREPMSIASVAGAVADVKIALAPGAPTDASELLRELGDRSLALLVGPEGGLSPAELRDLAEGSWIVASLGALVLRTETVATAVLGALLVLGGVSEDAPPVPALGSPP